MKRIATWTTALLVLVGLSVGAGLAANGLTAGTQRSDCPGTVECPLTGEEVCKDKCPLIDADRSDCPGKIECPLTGELVCRDRCPLGAGEESAAASEDVPACCRNKK